MNEAKLKLDSGDLKGAVQEALALVKSNPTDAAARIFLFELSCFAGDWERAEKQLDVIGHQDAVAMVGAKIYQQNLKAERDRINFVENGTRPESAMKFPSYVEDLIKANELIRLGKMPEARAMLDQVATNRPEFKCSVNDNEYSDIRDYNDPTMCVVEAIIKESYVWLPFEQIEYIEFSERKSLRDIFWPQAKFELTNGTSGEMFVPSVYVNTWKSDDDLARLGRSVEWRDLGSEIYAGEGAKVFTMARTDMPLLDITSIRFDHNN